MSTDWITDSWTRSNGEEILNAISSLTFPNQAELVELVGISRWADTKKSKCNETERNGKRGHFLMQIPHHLQKQKFYKKRKGEKQRP